MEKIGPTLIFFIGIFVAMMRALVVSFLMAVVKLISLKAQGQEVLNRKMR